MSTASISPLAPAAFPNLPAVPGVRLASYAAGLRYQQRADLFLAEVPEGATVAGVFTQSLCPSAPVDWCRQVLPGGIARAIVCNAGNANAFTGKAGDTTAKLTADIIASSLGVPSNQVFLASTGVIGETLPSDALAAALPVLAAGLTAADTAAWQSAAHAIRTTDTFAKGSSSTLGEHPGVVVGIAKGSGMIAPDMATMLGFVFTDLNVPQPLLQEVLRAATEHSFNRITVDSDTSTSDTVLLFATGATGAELTADDPRFEAFQGAVQRVCLDLAKQIVRDGEGATKFVTVKVTGAEHEDAAKAIAFSIGNSPLVKTALAAEDANWGRIVMAVGKAGQRANRDMLKIFIGPELVAEHGVQAQAYSEERATQHLKEDEVELLVDVGVGDGQASIWTCDLTHGYIDINAGYRS